MRLDELSDRFTSARGQIKIVAAALVAVVGLGAAVWAYNSTRNERNFDAKSSGGMGSNLPPEQRKKLEEAAKAAAEEAEKNAAPRQYQSVSGKTGATALDSLPEKVSAAIQNSPAASSITSADQSSLAERVKIALNGMVAGSPDALNESIKALGGTPRDPAAKSGRVNPLPKLMEGAELDLANISVDKPSGMGLGAGGQPQPGSGAFRVTADSTQTETSDKPPAGLNVPPGATVRTMRAVPGEGSGGAASPGGPGRIGFNSLIAMRTDSFPAVKDYASQNLPAYEVKVPAKLKGSKNTTPDMDIGVIMAQTPDGQWQPAGYNIYAKSPDVQSTLMNLIMSAAKEQGAKIKTSTSESGPATSETKTETQPAAEPEKK